ncbi:MAG: hypothetical protein ABIN25_06720 [Ginsengibacter sp.]
MQCKNLNYTSGLVQDRLQVVRAKGYNFQDKVGDPELPDIEFNKIKIAASVIVKFVLN